jgi:hypothetical protein
MDRVLPFGVANVRFANDEIGPGHRSFYKGTMHAPLLGDLSAQLEGFNVGLSGGFFLGKQKKSNPVQSHAMCLGRLKLLRYRKVKPCFHPRPKQKQPPSVQLLRLFLVL